MRQKKMGRNVRSAFQSSTRRKLLAVILVFCFALVSGSGCSKEQDSAKEDQQTKIVEIPIVLTVNPNTGEKSDQQVVEAFNNAYRDQYHLDVEWVLETEEEYRENLKRMNVTDELPAIIPDVRTLPSFYQMLVKDGRIEELTPYLEEDEEWKNMIEPAVLEGCADENGKIYLAPISTAAFACSGVFWNQKLFEQAGIKEFPKTWEEFWECCDKLKTQGITPLALHTDGTAWAPMLFATAKLADSEEGLAFMKQLMPESYCNQNGLQLASTLKRLFQYTTKDALHADFDVAYNNFFAGKAAMIANGYWMIDQIPLEYRNQIRFSTFPEKKLIASPETFCWAVAADYEQEVKDGAVEFLKFRTKYNLLDKERLLNQNEWSSTVVKDYVNAFMQNPQIVPNYQVKWNSILQEKMLGTYLPDLAEGKMNEKKFAQLADKSVQQYAKEQ